MPLSSDALSAAIRANLVALPGIVDNASLTAFCTAIASAVVAHITSSAQVVPTALVAPTGGGPVTGTGTIA